MDTSGNTKMSIEQKAKAYDEALELARKIHSGEGVDAAAGWSTLETIFPQLCESEDERIRKELLSFIESVQHSYLCANDRREKWIAYLEKQKYYRMKPVYDNQDSFESALEKAWKDYNDSGARTVDGCEDDYVECAHAKGFREGYLFGIEKQKKQKPAWSEEDEKMLDNICSHLYATPEKRDKMQKWLKSLRHSWKPSDHQMNILKAVKEYVGRGSGYWGEGLGSLIEDLEKLM